MAWRKSVDKSQLHPSLVQVMDRTLYVLANHDRVPFKVYSGLRTFAEQNELYAKGRAGGPEGPIVTKARGGQSMHNYGLAVDLAPFNPQTENPDDLWWPKPGTVDGEVWRNLEDALTLAAGEFAHSGLDFEWGGRWRFRDIPHVQVRTTLTELKAGEYPYCSDVEWLVTAHTTFLFDTPWIARRVQHLLNMQSYDAGIVDGVVGRKSLAALNKFQADHKIGEGRVGKATVEKLVRLHQTGMSLPRGTSVADLVG